MKNRKNILVLILSIFLAVVGVTGLTMLAVKNQAFAQPNKPPISQNSTELTTQKNIELAIKGIAVILTGVSAFGALITYRNNESWKRRQYIEEKIKDFEDKLETINVRKMLSTELQCVELFPFLEKPTYRFVVVEDCLWAEALLECKCNENLRKEYSSINKDDEHFYQQEAAVKACIRDNFNRFLYHLQQFEKMVESKIINPKELNNYLDPWFKYIENANDGISVKCQSSGTCYLPKEALLEYMGLLESIPGDELSVTQKDVRKLVLRFRTFSSFMDNTKQTASLQACELPTTTQSDIIILK